MRTSSLGGAATLIAIGIVSIWAGVTVAQNRGAQQASVVAQGAAPVPASLSRPTGRFGRTLGLPKDGKDLFIADADYIRFPLPPGEQAYADVDPMKIKAMIGEITAISRKSRDDGNQYWGRIAGTPYDRMTEDWVMNQFKKLGMQDVRRQEIAMKPLWYPTAWSADFTVDGKTTEPQKRLPDHRVPRNQGRRNDRASRLGWAGQRRRF